jgi:hypothetical protein
MEPQPALGAPGALGRLSSHLDWYWTLSPPGRVAFWATFGGVCALHHAGGAAWYRWPGDERSGRHYSRGVGRRGRARVGVDPLHRVVRTVRALGWLCTVIRAAVGLPRAAGPGIWRRVGRRRCARRGVRPGDAARASHRGRPERLVDWLCRRPDRQHPRLQPGAARTRLAHDILAGRGAGRRCCGCAPACRSPPCTAPR